MGLSNVVTGKGEPPMLFAAPLSVDKLKAAHSLAKSAYNAKYSPATEVPEEAGRLMKISEATNRLSSKVQQFLEDTVGLDPKYVEEFKKDLEPIFGIRHKEVLREIEREPLAKDLGDKLKALLED